MKYFVTGATGFFGQHLCQRLVDDGHEIVALVRNQEKAKWLPKKNVQLVFGDLSYFDDAERELPRIDVFVHLAGVIYGKDREDYFKNNVDATANIISCIKRQPFKLKRFLFASTLAAAGPSNQWIAKTECDTPEPIDYYGKSKLAAEKLVRQSGLRHTIFRPPMVYGRRDTSLISFFKVANTGFGFTVGGNNQRLSFLAIDDMIDAIVLMANDSARKDRTYFTSYPDDTNTEELWKIIGTALGKNITILNVPQPLAYTAMLASTWFGKLTGINLQFDERAYDWMTARSFACSGKALQRDLKWQPRMDLATTIKQTASDYRDDGWL